MITIEIGKRSLLLLISFVLLKIPLRIESQETELRVNVIVKHLVIVLHEIYFISALCDIWSSSGIDYIDLRSYLEKTVYCNCENGRASDMFNLSYVICVNLCLLIVEVLCLINP
jgi:hypothetical protein